MEYREDSVSEKATLPISLKEFTKKLYWRMKLGNKIVNTLSASSSPVKLTQSDAPKRPFDITCKTTEEFKNVNTYTTNWDYLWYIELVVADGANSGGKFPSTLESEEINSFSTAKRSEILDADKEPVDKLNYTIKLINKGIGALWISNWNVKIYKSNDKGAIGDVIANCSEGSTCDFIDGKYGTKNSFANMGNPRIAHSADTWPADDSDCVDCNALGSQGDGRMHNGTMVWDLQETCKENGGGGFYTVENEFTVINKAFLGTYAGAAASTDEPAFNDASGNTKKTTIRFTIEVAEDYGVPAIPSVEPVVIPNWVELFNNGGWNWF